MSDNKYISIAQNLLEEGHVEESLEVLKASTKEAFPGDILKKSPVYATMKRLLPKHKAYLQKLFPNAEFTIVDTDVSSDKTGENWYMTFEFFIDEESYDLYLHASSDMYGGCFVTTGSAMGNLPVDEMFESKELDGEQDIVDFLKRTPPAKIWGRNLQLEVTGSTSTKEAYGYGPWESPKILDEGFAFNDLLAPILWHLVVIEGRTIELPKGYTLLPSPQGRELWLQTGRSLKQMRSPKDPQAYHVTDRIARILKDDFRPMLKKGVLFWDRTQNKVVIINKQFGKKLLKTVKRYTPHLLDGFTFDRQASVDNDKEVKEARPKWWKSPRQFLHGTILISARANAPSGPKDEIIGHIKPAGDSYYITVVRGLGGPYADRYYNKGPFDSFEEAAEEVYNAWNKHGRIWVGE